MSKEEIKSSEAKKKKTVDRYLSRVTRAAWGRRKAREAAEQQCEARLSYQLGSRPLLVTLKPEAGIAPANLRLQLPTQFAWSLIRTRLAVPVADVYLEHDVVITEDDVMLQAELERHRAGMVAA